VAGGLPTVAKVPKVFRLVRTLSFLAAATFFVSRTPFTFGTFGTPYHRRLLENDLNGPEGGEEDQRCGRR
jgi:hypothetical protein